MATPYDELHRPILAWDLRHDIDVLVIGAGIAGLSFTLRLPETLRVVIVTKGSLGDSNTWYAQGGLAAAVGPDDDPDLHFADTIAAGAGLCDEDAVCVLVEGGPDAVRWLLENGTTFDLENRQLALGKEAAHSRNRVIHAGGDATGAEIERSLVAQLRARGSVTILDHTTALDLVLNADGSCAGAIVAGNEDVQRRFVAAPVTVLANGGVGQLWAVTSNPPGATGDGIAMALRAGAAIADLEFTQFHPTVFTGPGHEPFLVTEAIRGEGAWLRSADGERFMPHIHPLAELAPRDVVARAIQDRMRLDGGRPVSLDLRHLDPDMVHRRFPTISERLATYGYDLAHDLIPVAPAAHYFMGGIVADTAGRTSIEGLLAIGEVSCTGVHGANRLASNSLLEGLVFGLEASRQVGEATLRPPDRDLVTAGGDRAGASRSLEEFRLVRSQIQAHMSADVAVVRNAEGMAGAAASIDGLAEHVTSFDPTFGAELRNLALIGREVIRSALAREESRGGHFRDDFPERDPALDHCHQLLRHDGDRIERQFGWLQPGVGQ